VVDPDAQTVGDALDSFTIVDLIHGEHCQGCRAAAALAATTARATGSHAGMMTDGPHTGAVVRSS
jgi:hypothetical protein